MINLRMPHITAQTEQGQLEQIRNYLYQFSQELNWAISAIDRKTEETVLAVEKSNPQKGAVEQAQENFSEIKSLIIKSADIVNAYYEQICLRLEGVYVAQSDFGEYKEENSAALKATAKELEILFKNQQTISGAVQTDGDGTTIYGSDAWCKIGVLAYDDRGFPVYGMEIGQINTSNGDTVSKKFAQYRSDGVHLFDQNGIEVARISNYTIYITNAEMATAVITKSAKIGGYAIHTTRGVAFKWQGRR